MKKQRRSGSRLLMGLVFAFLYAPILLLIIFSFNAGESNTVWHGFSLHWYKELFQNRIIMESVYTTLLVSVLSTAIATVIGTFAAIGLYSLRRRLRSPLLTINNIPMMNADIVTGVSLCLFFAAFFQGWRTFARWFNDVQDVLDLPLRLTLGFSTLLIAHLVFNIPYVILNVAPKLRQMDKNLVDAAQDLGCTWIQAFWKVILPEIKPGIVSGALIAFTMSIDDFVISYFTAGSATSTLAMTIYGMTKKRITPEINAISTLLFVVVLVLLVVNNVREAQMEKQSQRRTAPVARPVSTPAMPTKNHRNLKRFGALAAAVALLVGLVALGGSTRSQRVVNVCSWGEYIDPELIDLFEQRTGIRVNYQTAESNEAMYSLLMSGGGDYDVITPSDYMIAQLLEEGMLAELNYDNIPNFAKIGEQFKNLPYDPENKYTVPYAWGTVGIIYDRNKLADDPDSWSVLYDDANAGDVLLINNSRDAYGIALKYLGYSVNTTNADEIRQAHGLVADAMNRGVFQGKVMDEVFQKMEGGNAAIATYYAGDYLSMVDNQADSVDLGFAVPKEGSNWFVDAMCVLKDTPHMSEAEEWINFMASTEASLANMDYIWYASPNVEALEQYPAYYEELYEEPLDQEVYEIMAAPQEVLNRCEMYISLPPEIRTLYKDLWITLGI